MLMGRAFAAGLALIILPGLTHQAGAAPGRSPAGPGDWYVSLFGGYVNSDGLEVNGHQKAPVPTSVQIEAEHGGFIGVSLGLVHGNSTFGLSNLRTELSFSVSLFDDEEENGGTGSFNNHDNTFQPGGGTSRDTFSERRLYDFALAFKGDLAGDGPITWTTGVEVFGRVSEDHIRTEANAPANTGSFRDTDVDSALYGAMLLLQPEVALGAGVSLVTDLGAGIYGYDADANYDANIAGMTQSLSDSETGIGFRVRAIGGLKFAVFGRATATLFGGIDFWSDVPRADLPNTSTTAQAPSHLDDKGLLEIKVGLNVTVPLSGLGN